MELHDDAGRLHPLFGVLARVAARSIVDRTRVEQLADREVEVLAAIARGGTNRDVGPYSWPARHHDEHRRLTSRNIHEVIEHTKVNA